MTDGGGRKNAPDELVGGPTKSNITTAESGTADSAPGDRMKAPAARRAPARAAHCGEGDGSDDGVVWRSPCLGAPRVGRISWRQSGKPGPLVGHRIQGIRYCTDPIATISVWPLIGEDSSIATMRQPRPRNAS